MFNYVITEKPIKPGAYSRASCEHAEAESETYPSLSEHSITTSQVFLSLKIDYYYSQYI